MEEVLLAAARTREETRELIGSVRWDTRATMSRNFWGPPRQLGEPPQAPGRLRREVGVPCAPRPVPRGDARLVHPCGRRQPEDVLHRRDRAPRDRLVSQAHG